MMIWGLILLLLEGVFFRDWCEFVVYEMECRVRVEVGEKDVFFGIDVVFVCVFDEMYCEVVVVFFKLGGIYIMCEKFMVIILDYCFDMYKVL